MLALDAGCAAFGADADLCEVAGAVLCALLVDGNALFAGPADAVVAVLPAAVDGFTAVFFPPACTGPSEAIDDLTPLPYPVILLPTPPMPPDTARCVVIQLMINPS